MEEEEEEEEEEGLFKANAVNEEYPALSVSCDSCRRRRRRRRIVYLTSGVPHR